MTSQELRQAARTSADFARMARVSQLALETKGKTWLDSQAAEVAGQLAEGHSMAALDLSRVANHLDLETA